MTAPQCQPSVIRIQFSSVQSLSRVQLCDPMNCSTPGLPVHHQLLEFTQTHVHRVTDAIQPSHPLSSPSPPAPNPSQHQGLFQWVNSSHEVAKVLELVICLSFLFFSQYLIICSDTWGFCNCSFHKNCQVFLCDCFFSLKMSWGNLCELV